MRLTWMERAVFALPLSVFVAIGLYFAHMGVTRIQEGWASRSWPTVTGVVTSTGVSDVQSRSAVPNKRVFGGSHFASVGTRYEVDGTEHESHRITLGEDQFLFRFRAERAIRPYARGDEVELHYDPARPERAVLEPGLTLEAAAPLFAGAGLVGVVLFFGKVMLFPKGGTPSGGFTGKRRRKYSGRLPG